MSADRGVQSTIQNQRKMVNMKALWMTDIEGWFLVFEFVPVVVFCLLDSFIYLCICLFIYLFIYLFMF